MPKAPPKDYYGSMLAPGTKKISIVSRRLGTKERLVQIAVCTSEMMADKIVEALNAHQGMVDRMSLPIEHQLNHAKEALNKERIEHAKKRDELNTLRLERQEQLRVKDREITDLKRMVETLKIERDANARQLRELTPQG